MIVILNTKSNLPFDYLSNFKSSTVIWHWCILDSYGKPYVLTYLTWVGCMITVHWPSKSEGVKLSNVLTVPQNLCADICDNKNGVRSVHYHCVPISVPCFRHSFHSKESFWKDASHVAKSEVSSCWHDGKGTYVSATARQFGVSKHCLVVVASLPQYQTTGMVPDQSHSRHPD